MYLIAEAPKGMTTAYARLTLEAQVRGGGIRSWWDWMQRRSSKYEAENVRLW